MSNPTDIPVITSVPTDEDETSTVVKQSFVAKTKNFVKTHKKPTLAVIGLVALVGVSALAGRKTASDADIYVLELESPEDDAVIVEETDSTLA